MRNTTKQGSIWRKWDLHLHTPETKLSDNYKFNGDIWAKYVKCLSDSDVDAFGITDYFSIDGYLKLIDEIKRVDKTLLDRKAFFPNIEFRLVFSLNKESEEVNLHLLFDNSDEVVAQISKFLGMLKIFGKSRDNSVRLCNPQDIKAAGGYGAVSVTWDSICDALRDTFGRNECFLVFAQANGNGGIRLDSNSARKKGIFDEIDKNCHAVFGRAQDRDFFLREDRFEDKTIKSKPKPVVTGSDCHSFDDCSSFLGKRVIKDKIIEKDITWIKADTTFEGLRQIIYEPFFRIHIAEQPPSDPLFSIGKVDFDFPTGTKIGNDDFCLTGKNELCFSKNLTCLIGGRGTGKSTVLNLVCEKLKGPTEFFSSNKLNTPLGKKVSDYVSVDGDSEEKYIEFLSQNEIEAFALDQRRFTEAIYQRLEKLDLDGKLVSLSKNLKDEIELVSGQINDILAESSDKSLLGGLKKNLESHRKVVNSVKSEEYKQIVQQMSESNLILRKIASSRSKYTTLLGQLDAIGLSLEKGERSGENGYDEEYLRLITEVAKLVKGSKGKSFTALVKVEADEKVKLKGLEVKLKEYLNKQRLSPEDLNDIAGANRKISQLETEISEVGKRVTATVKRIKAYKINRLTKAREGYESELKSQIEPVSERLKNLGGEVKPISLVYEFDDEGARKELLEQFQTTLIGEGYRDDYLSDFLFRLNPMDVLKIKKEDLIKSISGDDKTIGKTQEVLVKLFSEDRNFEIYKLLIQKVYSSLEDFKVVRVLYDGKPLQNSSFGQRCTATIVILLLLGNTPIIIDEPEAHLDSSLIANYLVNIIKDRKQSRQIIFATHNANLVINGDAELVHILTIDDKTTKFEFTTIENLDFRGKLLQLEGGVEAFEARGEKYHIR